jgi:hypothetical protein
VNNASQTSLGTLNLGQTAIVNICSSSDRIHAISIYLITRISELFECSLLACPAGVTIQDQRRFEARMTVQTCCPVNEECLEVSKRYRFQQDVVDNKFYRVLYLFAVTPPRRYIKLISAFLGGQHDYNVPQ